MRDNNYYGFKYYILLLVLPIMSGCDSTENEASNKVRQVTISNLVGLWDSSERKAGKVDVIYTRVSSTGDIIEYDFDGDESDKGLNCYQVNTGKIIPVEDNFFIVTSDMHAEKEFNVELELLDAGHALKIYFLNNENGAVPADDVSDKAGSDSVAQKHIMSSHTRSSQIWTRMRSSSVLNKEPSCSQK